MGGEIVTSSNKVILIGNLTKDPEIRYTPSGTAVSTFGLAVNHRYKLGEEMKDEVCFIDIVVFGKQAENSVHYLSKGQLVIVEGRLQQRRWESEDGQKRSRHEVVAQGLRYLPKRQAVNEDTPEPGAEAAAQEFEDVPF